MTILSRSSRRERLKVPTTNRSDFDEAIKLSEKSDQFEIRLLDPKITEEKFQLYKKYQQLIHKDDPESVTRGSFKRTPVLKSVSPKVPYQAYERLKTEGGHFHQGYCIKRKLTALAVFGLTSWEVFVFCLLHV